MKKAIGQTVRDLKRGVNKKVLKVPSIEQKVLDATSNESWGPHGSLLADIAQATRNYHEYQMIMHVIWKRINDTGKNWRHVYKALTVLEYLVAHGSERGIDEIREHVHQISTLSDFQYIDSSGRDQGSNVRRKSQSLVALVNDKERIHEVRQKGTANRDKYQSTYSTGRPGGYGDHHDDDHYASRDEDRYGNGKEREGGYRDDDRYSRGGDSYGREGDRNGGYSDKHYGRDGNRDNDRRGGHGNDDYQYGSRNRSPSRVRSFDGDDCYSSRSSGGRDNDLPREEKQLDHQLTEQSVGAPPSYEEAMSDAQNHVQEDRNGDDIIAAAPKSSSPSAHTASSPSESTKQGSSPFAPTDSSPAKSTNQGLGHVPAGVSAPTNDNDNNSFDLFDPRGSVPVVPPAASSLEMDIFESASDPIYSLALTPFTTTTNGTEVDCPANLGVGTDFAMMSSASGIFNQPGENPFGDPPFIATQENFPNQLESFAPATSFDSSISTGVGVLPPAAPKTETVTGFDFDASFGVTYNPVLDGQQYSFASPAILTTQAPVTQPSNDISGMLASHTGFGAFIPMQEAQPAAPTYVQGNVLPQSGPAVLFASQATQLTTEDARPSTPINNQITQSNLLSQPGLQAPRTMEVTAPTPGLPPTNNQITQLNLLSQPGPQAPSTMEVTAQTPALPPIKTAPLKEKFEPKSTVWADTLSRGLVDLNISGPKTNPHADLGIDFDSINRKEKRNEEKKASTAPASTITMGKAMGSGSGLGRTGASALAAPPNPMMGSSMGMGMGMGTMGGAGMGMGMGMGGFGGNMSTMGGAGMGMGMGMGGYGGNMSQPMGTGMNMGMNQGMPAQLPMGVPPGGNGMPGVGYNPMAGMGNYNSQQPYGGGYR